MLSSIRAGTGRQDRLWTPNLLRLATAMFLISFGTGLLNGVGTNFYVDTLGLDGSQVLWLLGIREIPGLVLILVAAMVMHLPLSTRAALSVLLMGIGYTLFATIHSYLGLCVVAVVASLGFHNWMPVQSALALGLSTKQNAGRVMGSLSSVNALASIVGMGSITLFFWVVAPRLAVLIPVLGSSPLLLRGANAVSGLLMVGAVVVLARLPRSIGETTIVQPRILLSRRYWLYFVLTLFEGSRIQVFGAFGTLILVQNYGLKVGEISLVLLISGLVNFLTARRLGRLIDRYGERYVLTISYVALALCFVGYATVHQAWFLSAMLVFMNLLTTLSIGLSTYVNRIAPAEELSPTLSAGVSVNHITSVGMSLLAGSLLRSLGYENLCWGAVIIIMLSVPFALAMRVAPALAPQVRSARAE